MEWNIKKSDNKTPEKKEDQISKQENTQETTKAASTFVPDVDIYEQDEKLYLVADVPGISKDDIKVTVDNNLLTLDGQIDLSLYEGLKPIYAEYRVGNYYRQFQLGEVIDAEKISAEVNNGVLKLTLPKKDKQKAVTVPVH